MMNFFQNIPTELHLNGPNVGFLAAPLDTTSTLTGIATFTAIGTATFPYNSSEGSFTFDWYFDGENIKDTSEDSNSNAEIVTISGISTITISGITGDDNKKEVFAVVNYIPGPDENIIDYPGEGKGFADSRDKHGAAVLTASSIISVTKQPDNVVIGSGNTTTFEVGAEIIPASRNIDISYQWQLEGENLVDGTSSRLVQFSDSEFPKMEVTSDAGENFTLDWSKLSSYNSFVNERTYTLKSSGNLVVKLLVLGAGGGGSDRRSIAGSRGGVSEGTFTFLKDQEYKLIVGSAGDRRLPGLPGGGAGGGSDRFRTRRGGGGGYSGLFLQTIAHENSIIIAGGGGGSTGDPGTGGDGGGIEGSAGSNGSKSGLGGSQTTGGSGRGSSDSGSALQGGRGDNAGGGGAGYYGGGGGLPGGVLNDGAGGGGSGYIHPTLITNGRTIRRDEDLTNFPGGIQGDGSISITRVAAQKTITTEVIGANTPSLTIFSDDKDFGGEIICKMTANNVLESPVFSNAVSYDVVPARNILNIEAYDNENNYSSLNLDLDSSKTFTLTSDTFGSQYGIIQFHSTEKDINLRLNMAAAKGVPEVSGDNWKDGGEGGTSTIDLTLERNVEYTIIGISNNSALFLYRKANLIVVIGKGGNGGKNGEGGKGGGANINGERGKGRSGRQGVAGQVITPTLTGTFGSIVNNYITKPDLYSGDTIATGTEGGQTVSCSKGRNFVDAGIAPCSDISTGEIKFTNIDGTLIQDSSNLYRGFKAGYTVTETGGNPNPDQSNNNRGGRGGSGVQGGGGGQNTTGGGGGAGYADGSVTVISANLGGNTSINSSITFGLQTDLNPLPDQTQTINFSVRRNAFLRSTIRFKLISGSGPSVLIFGPNSGTTTADIARGSIYSLERASGRLRLSGNTLGLEDRFDNDFDDLTVTPNKGNFQNTSTYIADF